MTVITDSIKANSYIQQGDTSIESEDLTGALENYTKAIELDTDREAVYNNRGQVLAALGQYDEAIADLEQFLKLKSGRRFASLVEEEIKALKMPDTRVYLARVTQSKLTSCLCGGGEYVITTPVFNMTVQTKNDTITFDSIELHGKYSLITLYLKADTGEVITTGYFLLGKQA